VEPWRVESVTLKPQEREIEVRVGFADTLWGCPQCQRRMQIHDYEERRWRHLDSCQFKTIIVSRVPSVRCPDHGSQTVAVPWAEKYTRFSRLFERLAIDVMLECSITGACSILGMSWDEADGIKQRAVKRGLARKVPAVMARLCVDEKGMGRGQNYLTIVAQVTEQQTTVEYVGEDRNQASLDAFWEALTAEQLAGVEAVAMDMWEPYVRSTLAHLPGAASKIVHDPFHLGKYMNEAVNEVRKSEHRRLQAQGDDTLKRTRQLWLYGMENVPAKPAERYFGKWYAWAIRSRLAPIKKVARMCKAHLSNILTFFVHHLTNGPIEGLNNKIQGLIKKAFGYRNKERFKADIFFHLGGLDLYPAQ
jgi:transposase